LAVQNNTQNVLSATELLKLYKDQTSKTGAEVDTLGKTAGSAISYMNSAMNTVRQMLTPSGGGGGGGDCRTFSSGSYTSDGHSESYTSGDGSSRSSGMAWFNVLGNENAAYTASKGESFANSVTNVTRNSCSGLVCSFEAGGSTYYKNDALITKDGSIVNFHPDDNILAFKEGSKLQGKSMVVNNTFNISGNGDPDKIADEILKRINRITRVGF